MADIWLRRTATGLALSDPEDMPSGWKIGDQLLANIRKPRDGRRHRKAFVLLGVVFPHTDYPNKEVLRQAMTIGAGFVDTIINPMTGEVCLTPRSWRFDAMDEIEFEELYQRMIDVALQIVPNSKRDDWEEAVQEIARF